MRQVLESIVEIVEPLGGPGLAILAFLDSSFLSLPEVGDALIVLLVLEYPERWLYYASMTTLGSVSGCLALFTLAHKGGQAFLRRRFGEGRLKRGLSLFKHYGLLTVIVASILPPPTPFKIFVLLAGASGVRPLTFTVAIIIGRGFRYGMEAWLTYRYGEQATQYIESNLPTVSVVVAVVVLAVGIGVLVWRRKHPVIE